MCDPSVDYVVPVKRLKVHSRLRLRWVVAQGNHLSLDLVETLLTEVVPVSDKPKFW